MGTFIGRNPYAPLDKELQRFRVIFPPLVKYAEDHGVKLMIENCPVTHLVLPEGFPMGMNIAYSPAVWRFIFEEIPNPNFGLNFDPSHLYWLGIDYLRAIREFGARIFHVHAKDTELLVDKVYENGFLGTGWFRYRTPGYGAIKWREVIKALYDVGYDYTLSIEHEDPVWEGSIEKVKKGLLLGKRELMQHIIK